MYDALVIGGGPAGLQAALTLGRMHRPTLVLDSGAYRNAPAAAVHNLVLGDGHPPQELRRTRSPRSRHTRQWRFAGQQRHP